MKQSIFFFFLLITFAASAQNIPDSMINITGKYFEDVQQTCNNKNRQPWSKDLYGPMLLVDRRTRAVYANMPDKEGLLTKQQAVYTGTFPKNLNIANTATTWAGVKWTMVMLPLPKNRDARLSLMIHELYHRIQDDIGLPAQSPLCDHLDTKDGRLYLRLELEALKAALQKPVNKRKADLVNALSFRKYRYELFDKAKEAEHAIEWNEGLSEFTGVYVSNISEHDENYFNNIVDNAVVNYPTFTRSLGYITGPLYGMLLSQKHDNWQKTISASDNFSDLLVKYYHLQLPADIKAAVMKNVSAYNYDRIAGEENERENKRLAAEKKYMAELVDGPTLELPLTPKMNFSFDPNNLFSLGAYGTVYPGMTVNDDWGRLVVTGDALLKDWRVLYLQSTNMETKENIIRGQGWELELKNGWKIVQGAKQGNVKLSK